MDTLGPLLILLIPLLALWAMVMRPAQKRQRAMAALRAALEPGQEVMTTSGLFGTVRALEDDVVHLEVADGVVLRFARGAVADVVTPDDAPGDRPESA